MNFHNILKIFRVELAINGLYGNPSVALRHELEKQGWEFDVYHRPLLASFAEDGSQLNSEFIVVTSPDGKNPDFDIETRKIYKEQRRKVAKKMLSVG
jgi:hypothetical protein